MEVHLKRRSESNGPSGQCGPGHVKGFCHGGDFPDFGNAACMTQVGLDDIDAVFRRIAS